MLAKMTGSAAIPLLVIAVIASTFAKECRWDKDNDYPAKYSPLVMDKATWTPVFPVMDGASRVVIVSRGAELVVACPGKLVTVLHQEVVEATCIGGTQLDIGGQEFAMSDLGCSARPKESIQKQLGPCGKGGDEQAIGFDVDGYPFFELIRVCFDPLLESNLYSSHTIRGAHIAAKDVNPDRPGFRSSSGFYTVSPNTCYDQDSQIALMDELLGDPNVIDLSRSFYFSRGHMSPDADFVTEQEQDATYYYINAAPQWQAFNNGNWKRLEMSTRTLAATKGRDLQVWSGAWQVLKLDDQNNNPVEIYLGLTEGKKVIPAPDVTWKVVYDPSTNEGAAIVGVNNPYISAMPPQVCTDGSLCSELTWLTVKEDDFEAGATYCCTVQDLAEAVPNAPQGLGDATLLTR